MRLLTNTDVAALLPMAAAIEVVARAMIQVAAGGARMPLRHVVPVGGANAMGVMSGALDEPACYGVKLLSLFPGNPARGLSGHRGAVVLFEGQTGGAVAMMDAGLLTAIRTAAASAVATRALAIPRARVLTLIGTGEQAWHHLEAMLSVRPIAEVRVVARRIEAAEAFVARAARAHRVAFRAGTDARAAVAGADIVCTLTNSPVPVLLGDWLEAGQHLNIVGASVATKREVDDAVVRRATIFVDSRASALAQAGELVDMIVAGVITPEVISAEIGAVLAGDALGRGDAAQVTLYRSLGVIAQDLACAQYLLAQAEAHGRGHLVDLE